MPYSTKDAVNLIDSLTPDEAFVPGEEVSPDDSIITVNSSLISANPAVADMDTESSRIAINSPTVSSTNPLQEESIVINIPGIDELSLFSESCPQATLSEFESNDNYSLTEEKVFEIPLLNAPNNYYGLHNEDHYSNEALCDNQDIMDKDSLKEDANSDSTVEYSLDESLNVNKEINKTTDDDKMNPSGESVITVNPSVGQSFSPLPSTSKDFAVIDMNDMMFNLTDLDLKQEDSDVKIVDVKKENSNNLNVVECSSGSDNADDEVVICSEIKPSFIDLSNYDKSDSDCEIIDVDDIISENIKVLNTTQFSQPKKTGNSCLEILNQIPDVLPPPFPSLPPDTSRSEVEHMGDPRLQQPMPETNNYYPLCSEIDSLINQWCSDKNLTDLRNLCVDPNNTLQDGYGSLLPSSSCQYDFNDNYQNLRRRSKRKPDNHHRKRRRLDPVIDLSVTSSIKPHSSNTNDVIVIDVDSPVSVQRSNNIAQISVSIMAPIVTSSRESQYNVPSAAVAVEKPQSVIPPTNPQPPVDTWNQDSSSTPPRRLGDCPVCLENFSKVKAVSTLCGHLFCVGCITTVKTTSKKCPTCRKPLKGKGYHPIFL